MTIRVFPVQFPNYTACDRDCLITKRLHAVGIDKGVLMYKARAILIGFLDMTLGNTGADFEATEKLEYAHDHIRHFHPQAEVRSALELLSAQVDQLCLHETAKIFES